MYPESYAEEEKRKKEKEERFETLLDFSKQVVDTVRSCNTPAETETNESPTAENAKLSVLSQLAGLSTEDVSQAAETVAKSLVGEVQRIIAERAIAKGATISTSI